MIVLHLIKENEMSTKFYSDYEESGIRYDDYRFDGEKPTPLGVGWIAHDDTIKCV